MVLSPDINCDIITFIFAGNKDFFGAFGMEENFNSRLDDQIHLGPQQF